VYVEQPQGFKIRGEEDKVLKLNKALYGLKQAPRAWNRRIDEFLKYIGYTKCTVEHGIYVKGQSQDNLNIVCLYVDDLLITGSNEKEIEGIKSQMNAEFDMTDLGNLHYFLELEVTESSQGLIIHQRKYITDILKRFNLLNCNPSNMLLYKSKYIIIVSAGTSSISIVVSQLPFVLSWVCKDVLIAI
jgi:hypothetical protein